MISILYVYDKLSFPGGQILHQLDYKQKTDKWHIFGDGNRRQLVDINIYHLTLRKSKINGRQKGNRDVKSRFAIHSFQLLFRSAGFAMTAQAFGTIFQNHATPKANGGGLYQSRERHRRSLCCDFFQHLLHPHCHSKQRTVIIFLIFLILATANGEARKKDFINAFVRIFVLFTIYYSFTIFGQQHTQFSLIKPSF